MGSSESRSNITRIQSEMVANVFTNVAMSCTSSLEGSQVVKIDCRPQKIEGRSYESNPACLRCMDAVLEERKSYYNKVRASWTGSLSPTIELPINDDYARVVDSMRQCTTRTCKACVLENISQNMIMTGLTTCEALNNVQNQLTQQLTTEVTQKLINQSDFLGPLFRVFGIGSSSQDIVQNITNRMAVQLKTDVISEIINRIVSNQSIRINGSSTNITGQTQDSVFSSTVDYLTQNNIFNNTFSEAEWEIMAVAENKENTIGTLGEVIPKTVETFTRAANSILGLIMYFVIGITGILVLIMSAVLAYRWFQRNKPWLWFSPPPKPEVQALNVAEYGSLNSLSGSVNSLSGSMSSMPFSAYGLSYT